MTYIIPRSFKLTASPAPDERTDLPKTPDELRLERIMQMVLKEWRRQDRKHPDGQHNSHDTWTRVLVEELGEVAKLLDTKGITRRNRKKLRKELTQVVAVSTRWLAQAIEEEQSSSQQTRYPRWLTWPFRWTTKS